MQNGRLGIRFLSVRAMDSVNEFLLMKLRHFIVVMELRGLTSWNFRRTLRVFFVTRFSLYSNTRQSLRSTVEYESMCVCMGCMEAMRVDVAVGVRRPMWLL